MMKKIISAAVFCALCVILGCASAEKKPALSGKNKTPGSPQVSSHAVRALTPDEIVQKADEVRSPRLDYTIIVDVESVSPKGVPKAARYEVLVKGRAKALVKTIKPEFERGRLLLMNERNLWAFFPDVSKPIRLSMQERLIGDVANGDIARVNFSGDYFASLLRQEKIGEKEYFVLELAANAPEVTYGKVILWADVLTCWPLKAEFYAISGRLLKACSYENYKMLAGALRPSRLVMEDPIIKGKKSTLTYDTMRVGELPDKYFTKDYMKKLME